MEVDNMVQNKYYLGIGQKMEIIESEQTVHKSENVR
jgi:hypothetical protein